MILPSFRWYSNEWLCSQCILWEALLRFQQEAYPPKKSCLSGVFRGLLKLSTRKTNLGHRHFFCQLEWIVQFTDCGIGLEQELVAFQGHHLEKLGIFSNSITFPTFRSPVIPDRLHLSFTYRDDVDCSYLILHFDTIHHIVSLRNSPCGVGMIMSLKSKIHFVFVEKWSPEFSQFGIVSAIRGRKQWMMVQSDDPFPSSVF